MEDTFFEETLAQIELKDTRYQREAYLFVRDALDHTQKAINRDKSATPRHVTGQQLLEGIRSFTLAQFGPMSLTVLSEWGIHRCEDFGEMVFNLIENGSPAFTLGDITNQESFSTRLKEQSDAVSRYIWSRFSTDARHEVLRKSDPREYEETLIRELNDVIRGRSIYDAHRFAGISLSPMARELSSLEVEGIQVARLNRCLLEDAYPTELARGRGFLAKTESDSRADFAGGYDFDQAFRQPFLPPSRQTKTEPTPHPTQRS